MASTRPSIDFLLNLVPDNPQAVRTSLSQHPSLADKKDAAGYSLLHAAVSYSALELARALVHTYSVDPNIVDNDGETCLYGVEDVAAAQCAVEELGTSLGWLNDEERKTAEEKIEEDGDYPEVVAYLKGMREKDTSQGSADPQQEQRSNQAPASGMNSLDTGSDVHPPPPLPQGVKINVGTVAEDAEETGEPDPEFRRRIEELAARQDFESEDGQRELRNLVTDAVSGLAKDSNSRNTKPRTE
ncbi:MAG: hypothetical protein M1822_006045 [Bathelium mastoideum]|nr:MAG: hypothetical protein M1822_006045 [Bathelium mastoideum]